VELRLDDVEGQSRRVRSDEDRLGPDAAQRRIQGTTIDAETAGSRYRIDVNFAISSPTSRGRRL
jgi:hypothetical protein